MKYDKILIVCTGNICRSPTAEYILKQLLPDLFIASAGINATPNRKAEPEAILSAHRNRIDISPHVARQLTPQMCEFSDLILVMEESHIEDIALICPQARSKTMLLGQWTSPLFIQDPYKKSQDTFDQIYRQIENACKTWAEKLK
ncbi:low molecular weight protein-tyrosine-phosphatase [Neisseria wadsworthii]|uniref:low molecular weight protein-tyrosine-phosphatase n=1 Tax=Neisseria wadsworthii TaxID=607711 RepID=UPI000D3169C7|nr:low molecular weight protein-tyrosine-phosphatase [Neisseria wadsworthii]